MLPLHPVDCNTGLVGTFFGRGSSSSPGISVPGSWCRRAWCGLLRSSRATRTWLCAENPQRQFPLGEDHVCTAQERQQCQTFA